MRSTHHGNGNPCSPYFIVLLHHYIRIFFYFFFWPYCCNSFIYFNSFFLLYRLLFFPPNTIAKYIYDDFIIVNANVFTLYHKNILKCTILHVPKNIVFNALISLSTITPCYVHRKAIVHSSACVF